MNVARLTDEDGIDGPFNRAMDRLTKPKAARKPKPFDWRKEEERVDAAYTRHFRVCPACVAYKEQTCPPTSPDWVECSAGRPLLDAWLETMRANWMAFLFDGIREAVRS